MRQFLHSCIALPYDTFAGIFDGDAPCKKLVADCICTGKIFLFLCPGALRNLFIDELFQFCIHARFPSSSLSWTCSCQIQWPAPGQNSFSSASFVFSLIFCLYHVIDDGQCHGSIQIITDCICKLFTECFKCFLLHLSLIFEGGNLFY